MNHLGELLIALIMIVSAVLQIFSEHRKRRMREEAKKGQASGSPQRNAESSESESGTEDAEIGNAVRETLREFTITFEFRGFLPRTRKEWISNGILLAVTVMALYFFFPGTFSHWVYQNLYAGMFHLIPLAFAVWGICFAGKLFLNKKNSLAITYLVGAFLLGYIGSWTLTGLNDWYISRVYTFAAIPKMPGVKRDALRFTPDTVAWNDMLQEFGSSDFTVHLENVRPIDWNDGFGYIAPITPDGLFNRWVKNVDGFMVYDDNPHLSEGDRVQRIHQPFPYGEEMMFLDNIWRQLYLRDPFTEYSEVYYLQVRGEKLEKPKIVAVAPRIRYEWHFPCFFVPVFSGVAIVHDSGEFEYLGAAEAQADSRFSGRPIFPRKLVSKIVNSQVFDQGFLTGQFRYWYTPAKMIRVPNIPHSTQMPYYTPTADGRSEWVVSTEPAGQSYALFRQYLVDAHNGERRVVNIDPDEGILGPERALQRVHQLSGYRWIDPWKGNEGDFRVVEAVIIPKGEKVFWKYTVTTSHYVGNVLTAVIDAKSHELLIFRNRQAFYDWYDGKNVPQTLEVSKDFDGLRLLLEDMTKQLDGLQQKVAPK